jgi:hypothetical protein
LFEQALKIDPNETDALAGDAYTYLLEYSRGWTTTGTDYEAKILSQADRAIALAPDNMWAHNVKSLYLTISQRANEGLSAADAGLSINPDDPPCTGREGQPNLSSAVTNKRLPMCNKRSGSAHAIQELVCGWWI